MYLLDIAKRREVVEGYRRFRFLTISYNRLDNLVQSLHQHTNHPNESGKIKRYKGISDICLKMNENLLGDRACSAP